MLNVATKMSRMIVIADSIYISLADSWFHNKTFSLGYSEGGYCVSEKAATVL